jgi:hypothetical protein
MRSPAMKPFCSALSFVLLFTWCALPFAQTPAVPSSPAEPAAGDPLKLADELARWFQALEAADHEAPRDTFDVQAVVDKLGREPAKLFEWVRDQTVWVPYRGVLRGAQGVLMDRLGNSLDRALLLCELLRRAGSEARLAHADLPAETAQELYTRLRSAWDRPLPQPSEASAGERETLLEKYAAQFQLDREKVHAFVDKLSQRQKVFAENVARRVADQVPALAEALGPPAGMPTGAAPELEAVRDHWWVQYRQGEAWTDLDPAEAEPAKVWAAAQQSLAPEELDPALYQSVQVRVLIETAAEGALRETEVLKHVLQPSKLFGQRVVLRHLPLDWPADLDLFQPEASQKLKSAVLAQNEWVPLLSIGSENILQSGFTESGEVDEHPSLSAEAKTGKAVSGVAGTVAGMFGPAEPQQAPKKPSVLTAEWIEYEVRGPSAATHPIRRDLFDLLGPAARASKDLSKLEVQDQSRLERGLALIGETDILALPCQLSEDFVDSLTTSSLLANREVLLSTLRSPSLGEAQALAETAAKVTRLPSALYSLALVRQSQSPSRGDVYLDRPDLLTSHTGLRLGPAGELRLTYAVDIVENGVTVRPEATLDTFRIRMQQGVLDTNAEALLMSDPAKLQGAAEALAASRTQGIPWLAVRSVQDAAWKEAQLPPDVRTRIEADLAAGFAVVVPQRLARAADRDLVGWWRVDPATGQTLGLGDQGWGAALVERAAVQKFVLVYAACAFGVLAANAAGTRSHPYWMAAILCAAGGAGSIATVETALTVRSAICLAIMAFGGGLGI